MPNWTLQIDYSVFQDLASELAAVVVAAGPEMFPNYTAEAEAVSENAEVLYKGYLLGKPLPNGKNIRRAAKEAAEGVARKAAGMLQWDLMNTTDEAKRIEEGAPPWDMKADLPKFKKARRAKDGTVYLIVPFRVGTPGTTTMGTPMPKAVHKLAKQLAYSYQLGTVGTRPNAAGMPVPKFGYQWGDKITQQQLANAGLTEAQQRRYQGLYRFNGPRQSEFVLFRTMSQKSQGWIKPATPGFFPLQMAIQVAMDDGLPRLGEAVQLDFIAMVGGFSPK